MPSRRAFSALLILLVAIAAGAALGTPAARAATTRDELMKTSLLALQCAVEKSGGVNMYVYPRPGVVSPTGGLAADFWPRDPWTGKRLTPGATQGHYVYARATDCRSYDLTGYLSGGRTFTVHGGMTHTPMLAYDHRGKEGLNLLFQYVKMWSRTHSGRLPTAEMVTREGAVGQQQRDLIWPSSPWDHGAMTQRADRGSFAYSRSADGKTFTLSLHQALKDDYVLQGTASRTTAGDRP
jgi:hypothetical protein